MIHIKQCSSTDNVLLMAHELSTATKQVVYAIYHPRERSRLKADSDDLLRTVPIDFFSPTICLRTPTSWVIPMFSPEIQRTAYEPHTAAVLSDKLLPATVKQLEDIFTEVVRVDGQVD